MAFRSFIFLLLFLASACNQAGENRTIAMDEVNPILKPLLENNNFRNYFNYNPEKPFADFDFDSAKEELSRLFSFCNKRFYPSEPEVIKNMKIGIQMTLFGFARVVDNGNMYHVVKHNIDFPTLTTSDLHPAILNMAQATVIQKEIYKERYEKLNNLYSERFNASNNLGLYSLCITADVTFAIFNYSKVGEYDVIAWDGAHKTVESVHRKAMNEANARLKSLTVN